MATVKRKSKKTLQWRVFRTLRTTLYLGDLFLWIKDLANDSVDSCVVDGPYGLEFMGEEWDSFNGAGIEKTAKSAGGFGTDSATNENAYGAARVRYGKMNGKLWTERPKKQERRAEGHNRPFDGALPVFSGGMLYQRWNESWAREVFRVLKPGGYLLAFGGTRTYHRLACGIEDAGFEIRDQIDWIYGSGFPKSQNVARGIDMRLCKLPGRHFEVNLPKPEKRREGDHVCKPCREGEGWADWGTAIKPAHEPICMARKPFKTSVAINVLTWGTGALNIGGCKIGREASDIPGWHKSGADGSKGYNGTNTFRIRTMTAEEIQERNSGGRWPSNVILSPDAGKVLNVQSGTSKGGTYSGPSARMRKAHKLDPCEGTSNAPNNYGDGGGASRFFYCPKPSKREKDLGLEEFAERQIHTFQTANGTSKKPSSISEGRNTQKRNVHPTIKPVSLMRYLVRLVTPPGGTVLDPMKGSGSTGVAAMLEGFNFIGGERENTNERPFFSIGQARINHAEDQTKAETEQLENGIQERPVSRRDSHARPAPRINRKKGPRRPVSTRG